MSRRKLRILQFTDDGGLWASLLSHDAVLSIEEECLSNLEKKPLTAAVMKQGVICIAERSVSRLSRAEVKDVLYSSRGPLVRLFFVDWCTESTQSSDSLYDLPESFSASQIPPMAQKFMLRDLKPVPITASDNGWGAMVMGILRMLSNSNSNELELMADVQDRTVDLYIENTPEEISVSDYLQRNNLGTKLVGTTIRNDENWEERESMDLCVCTKNPTMQQVDIIENLKPKWKSYVDIFVTSDNHIDPVTTLQAGGFPLTVCKELAELGFQLPTAAQAHMWPYIAAGKNVFLVAPQNSGKTLAYLLPLLTALSKRTIMKNADELSAVILVPSSLNAKSISMQAKRLFSWILKESRLRCTASYAGIELKASCQLLNGADLLVCTPPSLLRLYANNTVTFSHMRYLVFDDAASLLSLFSVEMEAIVSKLKLEPPPQIVVTSRKNSCDLQNWTSRLQHNFVTIVTSPLEVAIRAGVTTAIVPASILQRDRTLSELLHKTYIETGMQLTECSVAILTTTKKQAAHISQYLLLNSWPVVCIMGDSDEILAAAMQKSAIIVISDEAVYAVMEADVQIQGLIHYSIPDSKSSFCRRYGVLFSSIKCGTQCWCASLDDCTFSSPLLVEMMERVGQDIPRTLEDMAFKECETREAQLNSSGAQLCYYLKAFGECRLSTSCRSSHKISTKLSSSLLKLPTDGIVKVKVVHISTASRWWVSIVSHIPAAGAEHKNCSNDINVVWHDSSLVMKMSVQMAEYYTIPENRHLQGNLIEGAICAYRTIAGCYYRVQVLKFSEQLGFFFHHKEKARVRLIDLGHIEIVDVNQLFHLPEEFVEIPAQVIEMYICRIKPSDNDTDWSQEGNDLIVNNFLNKEVEGRIIWCCNQTLWLDVEEQPVYYGTQNRQILTPQKLLLKSDHATPNPHHLVMLKNTLNIKADQQLSFIRHSFLPLLDGQEVTISAVSSLELFYVQLLEHNQQLCELLDSIDTEMSRNCCGIMQSVSVGEYVIAKFPLDERWYRGVIVSCDGEMNQIFFLDYGDTEWICRDLCYVLPNSLLEVPVQAIECRLNIGSITGKKFNLNIADVLWDIGQQNTFIAKVTNTSAGQHCMHMKCYEVDLIMKESGRMVIDVITEIQSSFEGNGWMHKYMEKLKLCTSVEEQLQQVQLIQSYVLSHSSMVLSGDIIQYLLDIASTASENMAIMLLRAVAGLLSFQCRPLDIKEGCLLSILKILSWHSVQVFDFSITILQLIEPFMPKDLVLLKSTVESLIQLFEKSLSIQTHSHLLKLIWCLVRKDKRCLGSDSLDLIQEIGNTSKELKRDVELIVELMSDRNMHNCEL